MLPNAPRTLTGPLSAWFALTEACNNRCTYCYENASGYVSGGLRRSSRHLSLADVEYVTPILIACGLRKAILIGGEPTMNPQVVDIVRYLSGQLLHTMLATNGRVFSDPRYAHAMSDAGLTSASVSLHGWSADTYEGLGNKAGFDQARLGMTNLIRAGVKVGANLVLGKRTLNQAAAIAAFFERLEVRVAHFSIATPAVSPDRIDGSFTAPMRAMAAHVMDLFRLCTDAGIHASFQLNLPFCLFAKSDIEALLDAGSVSQSCHVTDGSGIVIRPDLDVATCTHLMEFPLSRDSRSAFASKDAFLQFWRAPHHEAERKRANAYRRDECRTCDKWTVCGGGCMVHWAYHDPRTFEIPNSGWQSAPGST
jgi:radical SAM protein with 4Fe4S-binding SPASM domain